MRALFAPLLVFVLLSGCVAPIQATRDLPQPRSLAEVNALLEGKRVTIERADGEPIEWVRDAVVPETDVRYTVPAPGPAPGRSDASILIGDVQRVTYVRNRGTRYGAAVGAVPFAFGAAAGLASGNPIVLIVAGGAGAVVSLVTMPVGAWLGQAVSPGGVVPLYETPVERYLAPTASPIVPTDR